MSASARATTDPAKPSQRTKRVRATVTTASAKRAALLKRLRKKAADADAGKSLDTTGLSDDQFIAKLRR